MTEIVPKRLECDYIYKKSTSKQIKGDKCGQLCMYDRTRCSKHVKKTLDYQKKYYAINREKLKKKYNESKKGDNKNN